MLSRKEYKELRKLREGEGVVDGAYSDRFLALGYIETVSVNASRKNPDTNNYDYVLSFIYRLTEEGESALRSFEESRKDGWRQIIVAVAAGVILSLIPRAARVAIALFNRFY